MDSSAGRRRPACSQDGSGFLACSSERASEGGSVSRSAGSRLVSSDSQGVACSNLQTRPTGPNADSAQLLSVMLSEHDRPAAHEIGLDEGVSAWSSSVHPELAPPPSQRHQLDVLTSPCVK